MSNIAVAKTPSETIPFQEAFAMAEELDCIRLVYGEDCLTFVKKALLVSHTPDWKNVVVDAVSSWQTVHPRMQWNDISP